MTCFIRRNVPRISLSIIYQITFVNSLRFFVSFIHSFRRISYKRTRKKEFEMNSVFKILFGKMSKVAMLGIQKMCAGIMSS